MLYVNDKSGDKYEVLLWDVVDATNKANNKEMVLYKDYKGNNYVIDKAEFLDNFKKYAAKSKED